MARYILKLFFDIPSLIFIILRSFIETKNLNRKSIIKLNPNKKLLIIGNGPSLKEDIRRINLIHHSCDIFVVNNFANYEYFKKIKPNFYFLWDQMFWANTVNEKLIKNRKILFSKINKINWNMQIVCPEEGY